MKLIKEYIHENKETMMENVSHGGSPAFLVDENLILVKYRCETKYGLARDSAEKVMEAVNNKNKKGIRTPIHYEVYRTEDDDVNYCFVLQEKAKGKNLVEYNCYKNDVATQIKYMNEFINMPDEHIDKAILDMCSLFEMGIEPKGKNIFYDNSKVTGGFTYIDFIVGDEKEINYNNIEDIRLLTNLLGFFTIPSFPRWSEEYTDEEKKYSRDFCLAMEMRVFKSLERVIPNFDLYRRKILRSYSPEKLNYFLVNGVSFDNLELTEEEVFLFEEKCKNLIKDSLSKYLDKSKTLGDICLNCVNLYLNNNFLFEDWQYNKNNRLKVINYEKYYDYACDSNRVLNDTLVMMIKRAVNLSDYNLLEINFYDCYEDALCLNFERSQSKW